eukprot:7877724-Alexandrium_andersonii.AAC.1
MHAHRTSSNNCPPFLTPGYYGSQKTMKLVSAALPLKMAPNPRASQRPLLHATHANKHQACSSPPALKNACTNATEPC